jgi:hypothetical protein
MMACGLIKKSWSYFLWTLRIQMEQRAETFLLRYNPASKFEL